MFDVIVFGATFAAAGIAEIHKEKCLVLEERSYAGYEFCGALQFGTELKKPEDEAAARFYSLFMGASPSNFGRETVLYPIFKGSRTIFGAKVVSAEKKGDHFTCTVCGVNGFSVYHAKRIVDTRCSKEQSLEKSYNLLVESKSTPCFEGVLCQRIEPGHRYILRCAVPLSCSFSEGRRIALEIIRRFSPEQKLILSANEFDYAVKEGFPKTEKEILLLPSKSCKNPVLAFEAGLKIGKEIKL